MELLVFLFSTDCVSFFLASCFFMLETLISTFNLLQVVLMG